MRLLNAVWAQAQNGALGGELGNAGCLSIQCCAAASAVVSINTPQSRKVSPLGKLGGGTLHYLRNSSANLKLFWNEKIF